jgi:hypothetical protein
MTYLAWGALAFLFGPTLACAQLDIPCMPWTGTILGESVSCCGVPWGSQNPIDAQLLRCPGARFESVAFELDEVTGIGLPGIPPSRIVKSIGSVCRRGRWFRPNGRLSRGRRCCELLLTRIDGNFSEVATPQAPEPSVRGQITSVQGGPICRNRGAVNVLNPPIDLRRGGP